MPDGALPPTSMLVNVGSMQAGFSQSVLSSVLQGSASLYSNLALKVVQYIQGVIADAANANQAVAQRVAAPIVAGLNAAQQTFDQLGAQAANQIGAGVNQATANTGPGSPAEQGAVAGQYNYNVWQNLDTPAEVVFTERTASAPDTTFNWCFRGGFDDYYDAINYKGTIIGSKPLAGCYLPGGAASSPGPTAPPGGGGCGPDSFELVVDTNPATFTIDQCIVVPCGGPYPSVIPGDERAIKGPGTASAMAALKEQICPTRTLPPVTLPPPASGGWYVVCLAGTNSPYITQTVGNAVPGKDFVNGPFETREAAQTYLAGGIVCPPGSNGQTAPPPANCMMIDLCDWKKFEDALYNALCKWYKECVCKMNNEVAFSLEDCDQLLGKPVDAWKGRVGKVATDNGVDDIIAMGSGAIADASWADVGNDPNPWG